MAEFSSSTVVLKFIAKHYYHYPAAYQMGTFVLELRLNCD